MYETVSPQSAAQGIGAAVENILLAATEMGYGTCYMTGPTHAKKEIEELIGFEKEGYELMILFRGSRRWILRNNLLVNL